LEERKAAGLHDGMAFTYRNPARSTTPEAVLEGAAAIVVGARRYGSVPPPAPSAGGPAGRVARYAWTDPYEPLRESLRAIALHLRTNGHRAVVFADDNALVDREAAYRAGIGWFGKNANLLLPGGQGSWFVLGSVVTTAPLPPTRHVVADGCGTCRRCLDGCPTGAIIAPGVVDASRCLAWLLQKPGPFAREHREALGDRIYGCDDCQEVCPPNRRVDRAFPAAVGSEGGAAWVPLLELLASDDEILLARHGRWYLAGRDPRWLRRNALVALGNSADARDRDVVAALRRHLVHEDPMLRAHAVWACRRLGRDDLVAAVSDDQAPEVRDELAAAPPAVRRLEGWAAAGARTSR
jgi:epoxyqueuosine reductase